VTGAAGRPAEPARPDRLAGAAAPSGSAAPERPAVPPGLVLAASLADLAAARERLGSPVVLVPTMGALHGGHRSLLRRAAGLAGPDGSVVASVFVNPRQFGPAEDLDRYPRTLGADLDMCAGEGVTVVFAPAAAEMYPAEPVVTVDPGPMGQLLEGEFRPGFFGGVLTVVLKLFGLVRPDIAVFGEKDAQQLAMVRRMSEDFDLGIQIASVPVFRDDDGLATSSRNRYLAAAERRVALALPAALAAGRAEAAAGPQAVAEAARRSLDQAAGALPDGGAAAPAAAAPHVPLAVDYLALVDPRTFQPVPPRFTGTAILAVAARVGGTRLIDNVQVEFG
jgi:pantoate--beta-alanine ligase